MPTAVRFRDGSDYRSQLVSIASMAIDIGLEGFDTPSIETTKAPSEIDRFQFLVINWVSGRVDHRHCLHSQAKRLQFDAEV